MKYSTGLASFVPSDLPRDDRTIIDLLTEIEVELQKERDERLLVEVTGPNGTPVYYQASLKDGTNSGDGEDWVVEFEQQNKNENFDDDIIILPPVDPEEGLEIRLGGIFAFKLNESITLSPSELQIGSIVFYSKKGEDPSGTVSAVSGKLVPVLSDNRKGLRVFFKNKTRQEQKQDLIITSVRFTKAKISGIISLLERMGISTKLPGVDKCASEYNVTFTPASDNTICISKLQKYSFMLLEALIYN